MHLVSTGKQPADLADAMSAALRHHQREEFEAARRGYRMMLEYGWVDAILTYLMACLEIHLGNFTSATAWFCQGIRDDIGTEMVPSSADVHIAGRILKRAAQKKIYDQLVHDDFRHYLSTIEADYDLIVAADVFIYTGDLDAVFALIRKRLSRDGRLAFSIEKDPGGHFHLQRSGRFAHSHGYIVQLAEKHGFVIETARHVPVRMENSHWIDGALYIMRLA